MSFDRARKAFEQVQVRHSKFGAYDTEPCSVFKELICQTYEGQNPEVPTTVEGWELFSDMPGNEQAAAELGRAAEAAVEAAKADVIGVARYVRGGF